jgi:hypothetical protein
MSAITLWGFGPIPSRKPVEQALAAAGRFSLYSIKYNDAPTPTNETKAVNRL